MRSKIEPQDGQLRERISKRLSKEGRAENGQPVIPSYLKKSTISAGLKGPNATNFKLNGNFFLE